MLARIQQTIAVGLLARITLLVLAVEAQAGNDETVVRLSADNQTYWVEQVAEGLNFPSSMVWLPNGEILIAERTGALRILRGGKLDPKPVSGTPASYQSLYDGLKDILVDPDFQTNQLLYLSISEGTFVQRHAAIYRARYTAAGLKDVARIFRAKDGLGGYAGIITRMVFLADKTLLFSVGTGNHEPRPQQLDSHMGKTLRINRDGSIPKDNPFLNTPDAFPEIWTYGHRVALGLYHDAETGMVWEVEAGPRGGDELNVLKAGGNFGWAKASWGFAYGSRGLAAAPLQFGPGIEDPVLVWMPSVTPSGLTRYRGEVYPMWDGDYFVGNLTTKALERLRIDGQRVIFRETMLLDLEERIRDVKVGPDNHLYVLTDHQNGRVLRLQPGRPHANQLANVAHKLDQALEPEGWDYPTSGEEEIANMGSDDLAKGRQAFLERCAGCHSVGTAILGDEIGPDLAGIYGSLMGRQAGFNYSLNMTGSVFEWNFATLNRFLANPAGFVPGTKMASPPVTNEQVRRHIIGFLKQQSTKDVNAP